jgi:catechol 2,3-dioxygenase
MGTIDPALRIRSVTLQVGELERAVEFYERVLGLPLIAREQGGARLGGDAERPALLLREIAAAAGGRFEGAADHGVSEALYLSDPDGLGIELYADRPRERWERPTDGNGVIMVTQPLDLDDLLAQAPAEPTPAVAPGTVLGHVHLKVADVPRANAVYRDALGFEEQAQMPSAAFLSAGGYHHHVGLNSWQSAGAHGAPDSAPGLRRIEFALGGAEAVETLARGLPEKDLPAAPTGDEDASVSLRDPDGLLLTFTG